MEVEDKSGQGFEVMVKHTWFPIRKPFQKFGREDPEIQI